MTEVESYLETLTLDQAAVIARYYARATELVPEATSGRKYAMPCLTYRDSGLVAIVVRSHGFSLYPFGSAPIEHAQGLLDGLPTSSGTVRFTAERPVPMAAFDQMVLETRAAIDAKVSRR